MEECHKLMSIHTEALNVKLQSIFESITLVYQIKELKDTHFFEMNQITKKFNECV